MAQGQPAEAAVDRLRKGLPAMAGPEPTTCRIRVPRVVSVADCGRVASPVTAAKGLGEVAMVGVSAAIGNAVFHATGTRFRRLPIHIEDVLASL